MKKHLFTLLLLSSSLSLLAQSVWQGDIHPVEKSGYYNIELSQQTIGLSKNNELTDIRILDSKKKEVPYFLRSANPIQEISSFEDYVLKQNITRDSLNIVIIDNDKTEDINRFYIVVQKADVYKEASVRGSNDLKKWYIVKQKTNISNHGYREEGNKEILILDIPQGNYRYYEITLSNNQNSPLEILKVGKIKNSSIYGKFSKINIGKFIQKDSADHKTYIHFPELSDKYKINKFEFVTSHKADFFRQASISNTYGDIVTFHLSSKNENSFFTNNFILNSKAAIIIENNSNPPLTINAIYAYGLNRYLCAYLEEGQKYSLQIDEKNSTPAKYDIIHFQNDIPSDLPIITSNDMVCIVCPESTPVREPLFIEKPIFLWGVIIIIGLFLTLICIKAIRDLKNKK